MSIRDGALRVAGLSAFVDLLAAEVAVHRGRLLDMLKADGALKWPVQLPDGRTVGHVTLRAEKASKPKPTIAVDEKALHAWVREHRPDELVEALRESYRRSIMGDLEITGGLVVNRKTGEPISWASVTPAGMPRPPAAPKSFALTWLDEGKETLLDAWRGGDLDHLDPTHTSYALPPGEEKL